MEAAIESSESEEAMSDLVERDPRREVFPAKTTLPSFDTDDIT